MARSVYIESLRETIKMFFVSGKINIRAGQISIPQLVDLAIAGNSHCNNVVIREAPLVGTNGLKLDMCDGNFEIVINENINNRCLIRFTIAKEISGIIMDSSFPNWQTELPSNLLMTLSNDAYVVNGTIDAKLDAIADLGACELLLPIQYQNHAKKLYQSKGALEVAHYYKIPEKWVERRFGELNELF